MTGCLLAHLVDFSGSEIVVLGECEVKEALIITKIEVHLAACSRRGFISVRGG